MQCSLSTGLNGVVYYSSSKWGRGLYQQYLPGVRPSASYIRRHQARLQGCIEIAWIFLGISLVLTAMNIIQCRGMIMRGWFGGNCWNFSAGLTCQGLLGRYGGASAKTQPHGTPQTSFMIVEKWFRKSRYDQDHLAPKFRNVWEA